MSILSFGTARELLSKQKWVRLQRWTGPVCILGSCLFVFWQLRPDLIFSPTIPAGGDMGAHVWGPAYLREHLLPSGRLSGWAPDWYGGFPAFRFYMVFPALLIALASYVVPYGVAFKLVSVLGLVFLPLAAATFIRLSGLRFPSPALAALFTLPFVFDWSYSIWGGNITSTLAGEFSYSISLALALVYLGVLLRGMRTGRHRVLAGVLLALVGLSHLIPAMFATLATIVAFLMRPRRGNFRWMTVVGVLAATLPAFWLLPFWLQRKYYFNIDWLNESTYWDYLVRSDWNAVYVLVWVAFLVGIMRKDRLVFFLSILTALTAIAYRWLPQNERWNSRVIPFYYISLMLLAALGLSLLFRGFFGKMPLTSPPPGEQPGEHLTLGENLGLKFSRRVLVPIAAFVPALALAVEIDDILPTSILKYVIRETMNVSDGEAVRLAGQVSHLAILILVASVLVLLVELISTLRVRGLPRWHPVVLDVSSLSSPGGAVSNTKKRRSRSDTQTAGSRRLGLSAAVLTTAMLMICIVAYPLRALGFAGHTDSKGNYGIHLGKDWVVVGRDWVPFGRPKLEKKAPDDHPGMECDGSRRIRDSFNRTRDAHTSAECGRNGLSHVPSWVHWNFSGYENKPAKTITIGGEAFTSDGYEEYHRVVSAVDEVGRSRGCGRVMWEYEQQRLNSYGTPMSLMLLPHWTNGCMGSMEGLFFESALSVPFHFVNQSELSMFPSRPVRRVNYSGTNINRGVRHLQLYGVRYYMAFSQSLVQSARNHPDLTEIAQGEPWVIFEVADSDLVEPFAAEPVVVEGSGESVDSWLDFALPFYYAYPAPSPGAVTVFPADDGPPSWERVTPEVREPASEGEEPPPPLLPELPVKRLGDVRVSDIETTEDRISFKVSQPGVPVLVKTSYFPNWRAVNAKGPYRVAPNLMAVIPEGTSVELRYSWTFLEIFSYTVTGISIALAFVLWRSPGFWSPDRRRHFK